MFERPFAAVYVPDRAALVVSGIIDELSMEAFEHELMVATGGLTRDTTVDLTDVDFLPSIALSLLAATRRAMQQAGATLTLSAAESSLAHRILSISGMPPTP